MPPHTPPHTSPHLHTSQALVSLLQSQLAVASSSTAEVRTAASQLAVLAGDCTAATALLSCHSLKLHDMSQALLKYHSGE